MPTEPTLPDLEFRAPDCPLCGLETNPVDGSYDCESCNLTWSSDGRHGERMDLSVPRCTATCMPHEEKLPDGSPRWKTLAGRVYACVLDADHSEIGIPHRGVVTNGNYFDTHHWATA